MPPPGSLEAHHGFLCFRPTSFFRQLSSIVEAVFTTRCLRYFFSTRLFIRSSVLRLAQRQPVRIAKRFRRKQHFNGCIISSFLFRSHPSQFTVYVSIHKSFYETRSSDAPIANRIIQPVVRRAFDNNFSRFEMFPQSAVRSSLKIRKLVPCCPSRLFGRRRDWELFGFRGRAEWVTNVISSLLFYNFCLTCQPRFERTLVSYQMFCLPLDQLFVGSSSRGDVYSVPMPRL